jgi:hypothetical protein
MKMSVKLKFPVYVRAIAFVMLFAMFHYIAGYRLMYSLGILYAKEQANDCMNGKNDDTKKFTFSISDYNSIQWSEQDKEFSLNNQMYDVKSIQKSGNSYVIMAYSDDFETEMITAFNDFQKELFHPDQSSKGAKSAEDIMSSFQKDYTSVSGFTINIFALKGFLLPGFVHQDGHSPQVCDNIWHPPSVC